MEILSLIAFSSLAALIFMTTMFFIAWSRNRFDLVDVAWGLVFVSMAVVAYGGQVTISFLSVQTILLVLATVWGLRLAVHIYRRWDVSEHEDKRYVELRSNYKKKLGGVPLNMYIRVFLVQALLAVVIALPLIVPNAESRTITTVTVIGFAVWLIGFIFETVGDQQLATFLKTRKKKDSLLTSGLWRYTRHPNYFGEVAQWWGIFIIAFTPATWWIIVSPLVITILILFISGVPMTEKHFAKKPGWDAYKRRTSKFLPLPPKKV